VKEWLARFKEKPWVAHLLRAVARFNNRLGTQFGAAITYFSVLALVPIVLLAFAIIGFVLTVARPDLLDNVIQIVADPIGGIDPGTQAKIVELVSDTLGNWRGVGIVGLLAAIYSGAGWMGNLKNAVRAAWRPDFDLQESQGNIVKKTVINLGTLLCLILLIIITFALASLSTALSDNVIALLGLTEVRWLQPVLRFAPIVISIGAGWVLFMFIYTVLPEDREPWAITRRGALLGAIGLAVLQYSTGLLFNLFSGNRAAQIFGPVIVLMLFFNLFSQLILFGAAWIGTARHEAIASAEEKVRFALEPEAVEEVAEAEPDLIRQDVAARTVRVGMGAGYVTGAATGVGIGAALAWLAGKIARRRD
jgi:membrane protein